MGAMYPAIDLFTGEKERKTLETLLTTPASRLEILVGKMAVVVSSGLLSAVLAIVGLFVAVRTTAGMPDFFSGMISGMLSVSFVLLLLAMLIPLTIFFAGIMVPLTIYAKSFKEAQSILSPMTFLVIFPAVIGLMPGIELTTVTALIPIVNISLATKEIIAGTIQTPLLLITIISLIAYATISVLFCVRWFGKETHILR
jgi:sodium transport system permease protein